MKRIFKEYGMALTISGLFVAVAVLHRIGIDGDGYVGSPLIAIEFGLLIPMALSVLVLLIIAVVFLLSRGIGAALRMAFNAAIVFAGIWLGVGIDSPTLLYMT